ncbi:class I fructose-bisphosphate aldolase [Pajaroellobacter abortibovis]|uniref:fructose-bisphosphate aldolase n=1 Tax=Pajaroellobacter abortibovis TaxID=1882918 RepID=A0A1L6MYQ0_9BACT|nr:class I fructose-bisphosphate aldolase [Pajaroellobacter abortibovis]APS00711.1 fructose-bisphosphate aldolase [Pajaroellobacter abortibovis]
MLDANRVNQILSWYRADNPGVRTNLARILYHGALGGTGKVVILPVDQGFEHGPTRSFASNSAGYDPDYHFQLAIDSGCSAYAAPLGFLEAGVDKFAGRIPLILKLNNSETLSKVEQPCSAITGSVKDALRLGCVAIGYTIYPGSGARNTMYENLRELIAEARAYGLPTAVWAYPRGAGLSKEGETAVDVSAYAAHIAAQLGAHIIKIKPPRPFIEQVETKKIIEQHAIPLASLADRTGYCIQSAFCGKRIVIFSGEGSKETTTLLEEVRQLTAGGSFGSIIGRNVFQRPRDEAIALIKEVQKILRDAAN